MVFSSISFLVAFLPLVLIGYYYCPSCKTRNIFLLLSSILFYAWGEPKNVFIMIISIMFNYRAGLLLSAEKENTFKYRKLILGIAILLNLSLLFCFKYLGFTSRLLNELFNAFNIGNILIKDIILPIGISFYTFQSISYLIDVYHKPDLVQKNILYLGLYISFFPQLIAGPIVRYHDINEQILNRPYNMTKFTQGVERFIIGLAKKVLIANVVGEIADGIFALPFQSVSIYYSWIGILAYTLQIYYDFSGYSDMAIGLGKMFGFNILENFNYPYMSKSITEFWRRWHISLSTWFKDYLYIPLGGNRKGRARTIFNLFLVFFTTGLWHGASFNFIFWGLGHGLFISIEKLLKKYVKVKENIFTSILSHLYLMGTVILLWVLFRIGTKDGIKIILKLFGINYTNMFGNFVEIVNSPQLYLLVDTRFYIFFSIGIIFIFPWWRKLFPVIEKKTPAVVLEGIKYISIIVLYILSFINIADSAYNPFIYFRF
jgi:alginate O-acetyltransferase complex protein AlgI